MDWFKKHMDAFIIISTIVGSMVWMNTKFTNIEKEMAIMKTVLILKNIMPVELAIGDK